MNKKQKIYFVYWEDESVTAYSSEFQRDCDIEREKLLHGGIDFVVNFSEFTWEELITDYPLTLEKEAVIKSGITFKM